MRAINVVLAFAVSALIGLAALELGIRLIPGLAPQATLNHYDADTGWAKEPGKTVVRRVAGEKIRFDINENGLRDDPGVGPGREPGTYRVLMLGDSFVLGFTVNRSDLFVDQLEGWWKSEDRRIDVVNAGTEGWSTDQEVMWFLRNGKAYEPNLVVLFPYENDIYWNGQPAYEAGFSKPLFRPDGQPEDRKLAPPARARSPLDRCATLGFLRRTKGWLQSMLKPPPPLRREFEVLLEPPPPDYDDWCARTKGALIALRDGCRFIGAQLLICPIPSKSAIDPEERAFFQKWELGLNGLPAERWSPDRPVNLFLSLATELGIPALDPRAALSDATEKEGKLYFEGATEWHFNARGNAVFATWLHDELDRREVFPPEHRARAPGALPTADAAGGLPTSVYVFAALWALLGSAYCVSYPTEPKLKSALSVGALLAVVFTIILGGGALVRTIPPAWTPWIVVGFVAGILGFVGWKLGRRLGTIAELLRSFTLRGHWYLMPLVVVLLTIGSLLVVAASSPLIAPFIYTLF